MKRIKKFVVLLMICLLTMAIPVSASAAEKISKKSVTLIKGQSTTLKVTGTKEKITWSSSKKSVATVSSKGKVIAKKTGTATITAKYGKKKLSCKVTVETPKINKTAVTLNEGKSYQLKISGTKQKVKWSSSKSSVATVSSNGKVVAKKSGTATITAAVGGKKYSCKVTVKIDETNQRKLAYQKLKNAIISYGSINQAGNKFLKESSYDSEDNLWTWCIIYKENENVIDFMVVRDDASWNYEDNTYCEMILDKNMDTYVKCEFSEYYKSDDVSAIAYIDTQSYTTKTKLKFVVSSNNMYSNNETVQKLGNLLLPVGLPVWEDMLNEVDMSLKDLGFKKLSL